MPALINARVLYAFAKTRFVDLSTTQIEPEEWENHGCAKKGILVSLKI
jgi:hypothetical protein